MITLAVVAAVMNTTRQDQGLNLSSWWGAMAIISGSLTTAVVAALNAIAF